MCFDGNIINISKKMNFVVEATEPDPNLSLHVPYLNNLVKSAHLVPFYEMHDVLNISDVEVFETEAAP
jgi:hypothetical protein